RPKSSAPLRQRGRPAAFTGSIAGWSPTFQGWLVGSQIFPNLRDRTQDGLGQFLNDMELADLMRNIAENYVKPLWIQRRRIGGNTAQRQVGLLQESLEASQECGDALVKGIVVEYLIDDAFERAIIDDGQNTERAVVQLVDRDIAGEISQGPIEIAGFDLARRLF